MNECEYLCISSKVQGALQSAKSRQQARATTFFPTELVLYVVVMKIGVHPLENNLAWFMNVNIYATVSWYLSELVGEVA